MDQRHDAHADAADLISKGAIYLQMMKYGCGSYGEIHWGSKQTIYALVLEPVDGINDEFCRVGVAQIPEDDGMAENWPSKTLTIFLI